MKILKTANYKKAMQEISYQELFNNALRKNNGDEREAAEFVLDMATGGTWAVWDQEKIDNGISKILEQFGNFKDAKEHRNYRSKWDADEDFSDRIEDEFSGKAKEKKEDQLNDKWEMLMEKHREPAFASSKKIVITAKRKIAQLDMVECLICGKKKGRDEMANSDVCNDCKDTEDYTNASAQMVQPIKR